MSKEDLLQQVLQLPAEERTKLVAEVERSLADEQIAALSTDPEILALLDARLAELDRDPSKAVPWEAARRQIEEQLNAVHARRPA